MGSSVGSLALGIVGAVIGAPFGMSAIGFSIGSSIGGMIFAPDGPNSEGPRLGDTSVASSSLGKIIAEHWGVTRTAGNVIWSGGIKEVKTTKKVKSGGKGGGKKPTQTTYTYFSSFATCLGKGPARTIRKIWADGKLIYDGTGESETDNSKYTWRLLRGGPNQRVDPLIAESINRRLAGKPDINAGNGPQATYTTMSDLISTLQSDPNPRSQLYASLLEGTKEAAEGALTNKTALQEQQDIERAIMRSGATSIPFAGWLSGAIASVVGRALSSRGTSSVPDFKFTPAYRGLAVLVFDDMALEDFGNRIPNLTVEVVWKNARAGNGVIIEETATPTGTDVTQITPTGVPSGLMATDFRTRKTFSHAGNVVRRFAAETRREDRQATLRAVSLPKRDWTRRVLSAELFETIPQHNEYGYTVSRFLMTQPISGNPVAVGVRNTTPAENNLPVVNAPSMFVLDSNGLEAVASFVGNNALTSAEFGSALRITGAYPRTTSAVESAVGEFPEFDQQTGEHGATVSGNTLTAFRMVGDVLTDTVSVSMNPSGVTANINGPVTSGFGFGGNADVFVSRYSASGLWIAQYNLLNTAITSAVVNMGALQLTQTMARGITNPFSSTISYVSAVIHHPGTEGLVVVVALTGGSTGILYLDNTLGTIYNTEIPGMLPPLATSGLSRSDISNNTLAFAHGTNIASLSIVDGEYTLFQGAMGASASNLAQAYYAEIAGLFLWEGGNPKIYRVGTVGGTSRNHDICEVLPVVIADICKLSGMSPDEYDVSDVPNIPVRGYSLARPTSGRQALETLMQAYFVDGIESDWKLRFSVRGTTPLRTINEDELGEISSPTGDVNWLESRVPEYEVPSEMNINYSDPVRDYQTNTAHKRRISNPVPSMYSNKVANIEMPLVMKEEEASVVAEKLLFLSWMSRRSAKTRLNWKHADLDPGDVFAVRFKDGRTLTDRIAKATLGANFEIEVESVNSGDPVFTPSPQTIIPTGSIPTVNSARPVNSDVFAFDIPLLQDYHQTGRASARYYTAVGSEEEAWSSATIFRSLDGDIYAAGESVVLEATWGSVLGVLRPPRALWSTDTDNTIQISLAKDRGDINSVTREGILNGENRALIYNRESGVGEIIQFQTATLLSESGTYELSNLTRGLRGTDYAVDLHTLGETFILLDETDYQVEPLDLELVGRTAFFKAVSAGQLITSVNARSMAFRGRSLMPYAPSRVRRSIANVSDLQITWNRRTRLGGAWDMTVPSETVALNEDFQQYELYLLPPGEQALRSFNPNNTGSFLERVVVNSPTHTFTAATLATHGLSLGSTINVAVYQISAQVGRGFPAVGALAP